MNKVRQADLGTPAVQSGAMIKIEIDGQPYVIVDFLHVKPGKGGAFVRTGFE